MDQVPPNTDYDSRKREVIKSMTSRLMQQNTLYGPFCGFYTAAESCSYIVNRWLPFSLSVSKE